MSKHVEQTIPERPPGKNISAKKNRKVDYAPDREPVDSSDTYLSRLIAEGESLREIFDKLRMSDVEAGERVDRKRFMPELEDDTDKAV